MFNLSHYKIVLVLLEIFPIYDTSRKQRNTSLKQIHYRHRKQGEKEDDYGSEGDDYPLDDLDDGGEGRVGSLHVALGKIQAA